VAFEQRGLSVTWSKGSDAVDSTLLSVGTVYSGIDQAAATTDKLLERAPHLNVVVASQIAEQIRGRLPVELRSRVITW
jgi:hypothetical protein